MTIVPLQDAESVSLSEINTAVGLASTVAYSVLQKMEIKVNQYQDDGDLAAHSGTIFSLFLLQKPVFKISFVGHGDQNLGNGQPAPDPMLLVISICSNDPSMEFDTVAQPRRNESHHLLLVYLFILFTALFTH
mmetsp:Transcript_5271/g.7612  ORF Transcript_5271/g.7612 Transcript_5271/m.7612 type:complete len:133 (-) Transcript_5271:86-484(-)